MPEDATPRDETDQQVWVCVTGKQIYHTDADCDRIVGSANGNWTREEAEEWGKTECGHCADEVGGGGVDRTIHDALEELDPSDLAPTELDQEAADG